MSFTIGRSYGTGRNYKVPNYYVNSQNMQSPGSSTGQPSKTADQPSTERPKTPGTTTPRTSTTIPGGTTIPTAPSTTPGSGTTPTTPGTTPGSRTTPTTPGMTPGSGTTPTTPGMTPGSRTTPTTPGMTPGSGTTPATPGMTPGSGMTPTPPSMTPGTRTTPTTPGSGTTPATPGMTPGSGAAPTRFRNITTPPASDTGSGTAPGSSGIMPESRPGIMPRLVPGTPSPATSTPSGIPGMMPGTTSQELPYFIGSPADQEDMDMNVPEYMYPNMPTGTPSTTPQPGSGMQPGMPFAPQTPQAPGMPSTPQTPQAPGMPFAPQTPQTPGMPFTPQTPQAPGMPSTPMPSLFPSYQPMPYGTGEMPPMNYPSYQEFPNMYLPNANYGTPMGVPLFPLYGYDNSTDLDRDVDYMKHLYPDTAKRIQSEIDRECDQMEYDGSVMFDEYPDKVYLEKVMERIYDKIKNVDEEPQLEAQSLYFYPVRKRNDYLRDLVSILLLNEIFNRRRHHRSRNRWY